MHRGRSPGGTSRRGGGYGEGLYRRLHHAALATLVLDGVVDLADTPRPSWRWRITRGLSMANEPLAARLRRGLGERLCGWSMPSEAGAGVEG